MTPKFSIIVPAYNAETTLKRCIESVISQTYDNWELIVVDDGSADSTLSICNEYVGQDSRIMVLHKENGGVSSARNLGIEKASGDWISFLDADDKFESPFLSYFVDGMGDDNFQLAFYTEYISVHNGNIGVNRVGKEGLFSGERFKTFLLEYIDSPILKTVHANFFLTKIVKENNIRFNHKIRAGEDHAFVLEYLQYVDSARIFKGNGYVYYLPYCYSLKYGSKLDESVFKMNLMEVRVDSIAKKNGIDLSSAKRTKWHHSLSNINIMDMYDKSIFAEYLDLYKEKCGDDYLTDYLCNRESRVASLLIQLAKSRDNEYESQMTCLKKLLFDNISQKMYDSSTFPRTTRILLAIASLKSSLLLKIYLYAFK